MDEFSKDPNHEKNRSFLYRKLLKGFRKIFDKEGFYIILFICICIVGTTAVWISTTKNDEIKKDNEYTKDELDFSSLSFAKFQSMEDLNTLSNSDELNQAKDENVVEYVNAIQTEDKSVTDVVNLQDDIENKQEDKTKKQTKEEKDIKASQDNLNQKQNSKEIRMILPVNGTITTEFAMDKLVYSKTLEQWTTHNGIDISTREGSVVKAALDGIISSIKSDFALGIIITLDHGDGLVTRYACVSTDEMVEVGQQLKKGNPISGVGKGVGFEANEGSHLHFEVIKNGKHVDPMLYLPNIQ